MRILHTADWHLGKKLDFYSRLPEQREVLEEIVQIAANQNVDMVIVAGDLFDNFTPSNEAMELLYKTLKKLAKNGTVPVIAIAGNHDSPDRVNVADVLARENGIILIGSPTDEVPVFEIEDGFKVVKSSVGMVEIHLPKYTYPTRVLHTAFANETRLKEYFGQDKQQSLQETLAEKWRHLANEYCDENGVNVLTTHLFMQKRGAPIEEEPDGEKPLNIGNADVVYSDAIPKEIQYAALGHLHRNQNVGVYQPVIYSSAILPYSFAEAGQQKYVEIIDVTPGEEAKFERIPLTKGKTLDRKTFQTTEQAVEWLLENQNSLVELTMETNTFLSNAEIKQLREAHQGIISIIPKVENAGLTTETGKAIDLSMDMKTLFVEFYKSKKNGVEPNDEIIELFNEITNQ